MSQRNTNVPGISSEEGQKNHANNDFYSRGGSHPKGTIVPGMNNVSANSNNAQQSSVSPAKQSSDVPVLGFLYSISRQGVGEYWPVHIGLNKIGRNPDNDIVLAEYTVSGFHASLAVRKMNSNGKVIAQIRDEGSKTGIYVNEQELGYEGYECKNGDIITIGSNYKLLLILINAEEMGLSVAKDFKDALEAEEESTIPVPPSFADRPTANPYDHNERRGTIPMDGTTWDEPGGTTFM